MQSLSSAARSLAWILAVAVAWGIFEASILFGTRYAGHVFQRPASGLSLFAAGALNYGLLGLGLGLLGALARLALALLGRDRSLREGPFRAAAALGGGLAVGGVVYVNAAVLQRISRFHPLALALSAGLLLAGALAGWAAYLLLRRALPAGASPRGLRLLAQGAGGLAALFLIVGLVRGAAAEPPPPEAPPPAPAGREAAADLPDIVLITIETTRADRMNHLGFEGDTTSPHLDDLASRGVAFTRAYAQAPWTRPSMASLMTGLYPSQHGLVTSEAALHPSAMTLPKALAAAGYTTATFFTVPHAGDPAFGFDVSYHRFPPPDPHYVSPFASEPFWIHRFQNAMLWGGLKLTFPSKYLDWYADARRVNRQVLSWLDSGPPGPLFLHVHYVDPHDPYFEHPYPAVQFNPRGRWNLETLLQRYQGEIRFVDRGLAELLEGLRDRGRMQDPLVVVTSDHGEEFLDHGGWIHGRHLFAEVLHVPLLMMWEGVLPAGQRVPATVGTVDVGPTILELAGLPVPDSFEGRSLLPLIRGEGEEREVLSQLTTNVGEHNSLIAGGWKLIRTESRSALFDVANDPLDQNDLAGEHPDELRRMEERLDALLARLETRSLQAGTLELSDEEIRKLKALGYMN